MVEEIGLPARHPGGDPGVSAEPARRGPGRHARRRAWRRAGTTTAPRASRSRTEPGRHHHRRPGHAAAGRRPRPRAALRRRAGGDRHEAHRPRRARSIAAAAATWPRPPAGTWRSTSSRSATSERWRSTSTASSTWRSIFSDIYDRWPGLETYDVCQEPPDPDGTPGRRAAAGDPDRAHPRRVRCHRLGHRHRRGPRARRAGRPARAHAAGQHRDGRRSRRTPRRPAAERPSDDRLLNGA